MSRTSKLLPRLWESLETLNADAEIANVVRRIRSSGGRPFADRKGDKVSLQTPDHGLQMQLRALGFLLGRYQHPDPAVDRARQHVQAGLTDSTSVAGEDLLQVLGFLHLMIRELMHSQARIAQTVSVQGGVSGPLRESLDEVVRAMGAGR